MWLVFSFLELKQYLSQLNNAKMWTNVSKKAKLGFSCTVYTPLVKVTVHNADYFLVAVTVLFTWSRVVVVGEDYINIWFM